MFRDNEDGRSLKKTDVGEFAGEFGGQGRITGAGGGHIGGRVRGGQVAPALEGAFGRRGHGDQWLLEHDGAAADAVMTDDLIKARDFLAALDETFDHPKDRPAVEDFGPAFGPHASDMAIHTIGPLGARIALPSRETLDVFGANAEFDEMHRFFHRVAPKQTWIW